MSEIIDLDLPDAVLIELAKAAHEDDVTLNQKISHIVILRLYDLVVAENAELKDKLAKLEEANRQGWLTARVEADHADDLLEEKRGLEVRLQAQAADAGLWQQEYALEIESGITPYEAGRILNAMEKTGVDQSKKLRKKLRKIRDEA